MRLRRILLGQSGTPRRFAAIVHVVLVLLWHPLMYFTLAAPPLEWLRVHASRFWHDTGVTSSYSSGATTYEESDLELAERIRAYAACMTPILIEGLVAWFLYSRLVRRPRPRFHRFLRHLWRTWLYGTVLIPGCFIVTIIAPVVIPIPLVVPVYLCGMPALLARVERDRRCRRIARRCPQCGYWLYGNVSGICPECGATTRRVPARVPTAIYLAGWTGVAIIGGLVATVILCSLWAPRSFNLSERRLLSGPQSQAYSQVGIITFGQRSGWQPASSSSEIPPELVSLVLTANSGDTAILRVILRDSGATYIAPSATDTVRLGDLDQREIRDRMRTVGIDTEHPGLAQEVAEVLRIVRSVAQEPIDAVSSPSFDQSTLNLVMRSSSFHPWFAPAVIASWLLVWAVGSLAIVKTRRHGG